MTSGNADFAPTPTEDVIVAVLLARGGSKGVPGKNMRRVGGLTLTARAVRAAQQSTDVSAVYVSTDDQAISAEARRYGARVIDRPAALSSDEATSESGWLHALDQIREDYPGVGRLVLLQCTSPFTTGDDIDGCLATMDAKSAACAFSAIPNHAFLWTVAEDGFARGVNHDETRPRRRRQDLPPSVAESGAIYCVRVEDFERTGSRFCGPAACYVVDHPPVEIDTLAELEICDALARRVGADGPGNERLHAVKAFVMDFDGVHTDDKAYVDQNGVESVVVSRSDGLGIGRLREDGRCAMLILSKEKNSVVSRRAEKLQVDCIQGCDDKVAALDAWLQEKGVSWSDTLFIGNDVNDIPAMEKAGFSACPSDAYHSAAAVADWIVPARGGEGAVRAVADALLMRRQ